MTRLSRTPAAAATLAAATLVRAGCAATPATVLRVPNAAPDSPTSRAVEVPAALGTVYISGQTPEPLDASAALYSRAYWGDTQAQTQSVLRKVEASLKAAGLGLGDVVKMNVYLVGDPANEGRMDTAGFGKAYAEFFGSAAQPLRPARTTLQIAALGRPGMWVEIDVIAARPR